MGAVVSGFHHVKLPVTDVARSCGWYERVLGLAVALEFVEDGVLMGAALRTPDGTTSVGVRHDPVRAAALSGFDAVALAVPDRDDIEAWRDRLGAIGEPYDGVVPGHQGGSVLVGLRDPDGIEIRLYAA